MSFRGVGEDADIEMIFDLQTERIKKWMLKLVLAQTALFLIIALGAVVVAGVLWG